MLILVEVSSSILIENIAIHIHVNKDKNLNVNNIKTICKKYQKEINNTMHSNYKPSCKTRVNTPFFSVHMREALTTRIFLSFSGSILSRK